jgi:hypothetical protein
VPFIASGEEQEAFFRGDEIALLEGRIVHGTIYGFDLLLIRRRGHHRISVAGPCNEFLSASARLVNPLLPALAGQFAIRRIAQLLPKAARSGVVA